MRNKLSTFVVFILISILVFAFYPLTNSTGVDIDSPGYEKAKQDYYNSLIKYREDLALGKTVVPPVDPGGFFTADENGNLSLANSQTGELKMIQPFLEQDVVNTYIFTQTTQTYTSINTTGTMVTGSTNCDDATYGTFPIGFTFTYNGSAQTTFGVCCNGFLSFGVIPSSSYTPLSTWTNVIAPGGQDCQLYTDGAIYYQTTGSAPNRVCTIEWYHQGFWPTSGNELSYQIKLYETTNAVQLVYQTGSHISTSVFQVGINGSPNTDFANRTTTSNWSATTAGGTNAATCSFSPTVYPASGLTFQWAPPAPPPTPVQVRPVYGAVGRPQNDTLQWNASTGATNYNLQLATDTNFTSILYSDTTLTGTQYTIGTFTPLSTYWWRVRAKNAVGWSAFTPGWKFKIMGPATIPVLLTPANNAVNQPVALSCFWRKAVDQTARLLPLHIISPEGEYFPDAVSNYWFEIYSDTTAAPLVRDSTLTDTTRALTGLTNNTNYWWRVKAKNNIGWGTFSAYFKFTTVVAIPAAPSNIYPANGSTGIIPSTLIDWSLVSGAATYKLQVSTDSTFTTAQLDTTVSVDSVRIPVGRLLNNTRYYWHVRSQNAGGNSAYSPLWNFTTSPLSVSGTGEIPKVFRLYPAYPNPFNPTATIKFDIPVSSAVNIEIFNSIGQSVSTLVNSDMEAGSYSVIWDAAGSSSGVYFYRLTAGNYTEIHKMVLLK